MPRTSFVVEPKFREARRAAGLENNVDLSIWQKPGVVDVEPVQDGRTAWLRKPERHQNRIRCKDCGGQLSVIMIINAHGRILMNRPLPDHALTYADSG